jgi:hypothetical protein
MRTPLALVALFLGACSALAADERYVVALANARATLDDTIPFVMERGDYYPLADYDEDRGLVLLRLGPFKFWARASNVALVPQAGTAAAAKKYATDAELFLAKLMADLRRAEQERSAKQERRAAERQPVESVNRNTYGSGINSDEFGRPHTYRTRDGQRVPPMFQGGVKRDAYGHGVHADEFGRPIYDGQP